jgi:beta-N-acetylhexosaminidase
VVAVPAEESDVGAAAGAVAQGAGGVLLFCSAAPPNLAADLHTLDAAAPGSVLPLVMTDEEGGGVQRMANLVGSMPWARQMGGTMTPAAIESLAESVGHRMLALGVTMDLAPVLDVDGGAGPHALDPDGDRSFSADPSVAATDGLAFAAGLLAAGVIPVVKHFPGLGGASANTDYGPAQTQPYSSLRQSGLLPFEQAIAAGMPAVLVSNASVPGLTTGPASLSSAAIQGLLEGQLQFHGLVMTDSLSAGAISALGLSVPQAAVRAIAAGADMVLFSASDPDAALGAIVAALVGALAAGEISSGRLINAANQVLVAKGISLCGAG